MKPVSTFVSRRYQRELFGVEDSDIDRILQETYNASDKSVEECIEIFRGWYSKQAHLPDIYFDDGYIKRLLSNNKMSIEGVKGKVDNLLTAMGCIPEIFGNRDPWSPEITRALKNGLHGTVPKLTKDKYRLCIFKLVPETLEHFDPAYCFVSLFMFGDMRLSQDAVSGDIFLWDLSALKMFHVKKINPMLTKKVIFLAQHCYGSRIKAIHLVNVPSYADFILSILKSTLTKKVGNRVFIHNGVKNLRDHIPKDVLPKEYGGDFHMTVQEMTNTLTTAMKSPEWREWFLTSMGLKTDESKRPNGSKLEDDLQGICGTFRNLDID